MHEHDVPHKYAQKEGHLVRRNAWHILAVIIPQFSYQRVHYSRALVLRPLALGESADEGVALLLVGEGGAGEVGGEEEEGDAEDEEGGDEPECEEEDEDVALVLALGAYSFEEDEKLVVVGSDVLHGFDIINQWDYKADISGSDCVDEYVSMSCSYECRSDWSDCGRDVFKTMCYLAELSLFIMGWYL